MHPLAHLNPPANAAPYRGRSRARVRGAPRSSSAPPGARPDAPFPVQRLVDPPVLGPNAARLLHDTPVAGSGPRRRALSDAGPAEFNPSVDASRLVHQTWERARAIATVGSPAYVGNNNRGPVAAGVMDTAASGAVSLHGNHPSAPPIQHPILQRRLTAYTAETERERERAEAAAAAGQPVQAFQPRADHLVGSHAEVWALNDALNARDARAGRETTEAELPQFLLHNVATGGAQVHRMRGIPPRCTHCQALTQGVTVVETAAPQRPGGPTPGPRY